MNEEVCTLYRPVGLSEYQLIAESGFRRFPPRLEWQPIFYPVVNREYAEQIARDWNTRDEASGWVGIVTAFEVPTAYASQFQRRIVGGSQHEELWVPAEELFRFNRRIRGAIRILRVFYGNQYAGARDISPRS